MTDFKWLYISSTIIKEAVRAGGDVRGLVPDAVLSKLYTRCGRELPG
jgi:pantetheine-phosphate adenylyltransferase